MDTVEYTNEEILGLEERIIQNWEAEEGYLILTLDSQ